MRRAILGAALAFTGLLGFLTLYVLFTSGPDVLVVISALVIALFASGIVGALTHPPDDR
jgi:hypothetical protein